MSIYIKYYTKQGINNNVNWFINQNTFLVLFKLTNNDIITHQNVQYIFWFYLTTLLSELLIKQGY